MPIKKLGLEGVSKVTLEDCHLYVEIWGFNEIPFGYYINGRMSLSGYVITIHLCLEQVWLEKKI